MTKATKPTTRISDVEDVDGDQFPVGDVRGELAEARRLLVLGMGERGGDRAAEEHLAEEARGGDRADRAEQRRDFEAVR